MPIPAAEPVQVLWPLRGYRLYLDGIERVWAAVGSGQPRVPTPGPSQEGLAEMLEALVDPGAMKRVMGHVWLSLEDGTEMSATHLHDVARHDVVAFTVSGHGASLHIDRKRHLANIEWSDLLVAREVLRSLEPRRQSRIGLAWKPYRCTFIPMTKAEHRETVRHRFFLWLTVPGAALAIIGLFALVVRLLT